MPRNKMLYNKEIIKRAERICVYMCCIFLQLRFWPLRWCLHASYEEDSHAGRTMIPKCPRASVKPVFKRQARRSNPCHCTACLPYRLTYFRSTRIQWQATLAVSQRRQDAALIMNSFDNFTLI